MSSAQGSQSGISVREEAVWGTKDAGQFTGVNFTSEDMAFNIENVPSNTVRPDRQTADLIQVGADTSGGFETEFQAVNLDPLLPACLFSADWAAPPAPESVVFTTEVGGGVGGLMTVGDSSDFSIGQVLWLTGTVSNNGMVVVKALADATHVQTVEPLVTETSVATTFTGHYIRNGTTKTSFTIERSNNDVSQFFLFTGMTPNTLEMSVESGSPVMANISFVGKEDTLAQTTGSSPAASALSTNPVINAVSSVGSVTVDGTAVASCLLQKVDFTVDNKVEGKKAVGTLGYCDADAKSLSLTGNLSLYFQDETYYDKYKAATSFGLLIPLFDSLGNYYVVYLPECKFDAATVNVSGKDDDVLMETTFVSTVDADADFTIQMTRLLV